MFPLKDFYFFFANQKSPVFDRKSMRLYCLDLHCIALQAPITRFESKLVGTARFELATPCPPDKYATRLRYAPNALTEC